MAHEAVLQAIHRELRRIHAPGVKAALDPSFEPETGELVRVQLDAAEWRLPPAELEQLLKDVPSGAGDEAVKRAIEQHGNAVWHGPAPKDSRDTSHGPT
jgi:hypothetical protein